MKTLVTFFIILALSFSTVNAQWFEVSTIPNQSLYSVYFLNQNLGWACGSNATIIKTTDGGISWITQSSPTINHFEKVKFVDENNGWIWGWNKLIKTTNGGANWSEVVLPFSFTDCFFISPATGWITSRNNTNQDSEIYKTTDGGITWTSQFFSMDQSLGAIFFLNENYAWVCGFYEIIRTNNGVLTWTPDFTVSFGGAPWDLSFVDTLTGWLAHNTLGSYTISKTTDGGEIWFDQLAESGKFIESIYFLNLSTGYAAGNTLSSPNNPERGIIKKTTDGGLNWTEQYSDTGSLHSIYMVNELIGYAAGGILLKTINGGLPVELFSFSAECVDNDVLLSWTTASETNNKGFEVERSIKNSKLKIKNFEPIGFVNGKGTSTELNYYSFKDENLSPGKYLYRLKQIDFDGDFEYSNEIEVEIGLPDKFELYQNYPNPFNPTTKIRYSIPFVETHGGASVQNILLNVYDVLGNEITTLVNEEKPPGVYEVEFDGSKLSSGVYFYQLRAGSVVNNKKMIYLR